MLLARFFLLLLCFTSILIKVNLQSGIMPRKRKSFVPLDWLEPTSDNEWEPSALPSTINFKRIKLDQNTCEDTENEPFIDISSDSEVHSFGRFQDSPQEPHFPDEPFIDISSCETLNSPQEPHFPDEPFVDISSGDEVLIQPLPNIADEPVVEIESADEYNPQFLHNYNYINGDDVIHEKEQTGEPKEDEEEEGEEEEDDEAGYADVEPYAKEAYKKLLEQFSHDWIEIESSHQVSKVASNLFWKLAFDKLESIFKIKEDQKITRKIPKFTQIRRRLHKEKVPRISIEVAYKSKETGEITTVKDIERTPVAKFPPHLYTKLYEQATVEVKDILKIHNLKCPNSANRMQISSDGVSECKSNSVTLDVYSCKAVNCRVIYPIRIIRPLNKFKIDHRQNLEHVINDMLENLCLIAQYIADNLKRATAKECLNHASTFPCEYCFSSAERFYLEKTEDHTNRQIQIEILAEKIRKLKEIVPSTQAIKKEIKKLEEISKQLKRKNNKRSHLVMPASTRHGEYRTAEKMKINYEKIDENPNLPASERKGVVRRSALLDIPNFDAQHDCPVEYMHATCIGVVKQMVELTFDVGENRPRITKRKLSTAFSFNELMKYVKVPGEFPRRIRELDFSVMKAAEYRNVILFYFPIVIQCIPVDDKERLLWLYLAFMIRSCVLSTQEFSTKLIPDIDFCSEKFYLLYEKVYGPRNCTYNTHVVSSHLMDMRYHGPLTFTSAFLFESFYGEMRNAFVPGTPSPLKQIMQNVFLKRAVSKHSCKPNLIFCDHDTSLECNTLFYVYKHSAYHIYTIVKIQGEELITNEIETEECSFAEAPKRLKWGEIGVFCEGKMGTEFVVINANNVSGKVLRVGKYLLTCPDDVLTET